MREPAASHVLPACDFRLCDRDGPWLPQIAPCDRLDASLGFSHTLGSYRQTAHVHDDVQRSVDDETNRLPVRRLAG